MHRGHRPNTQQGVQEEVMSKLRIKEEKELPRRGEINGCSRQLTQLPYSMTMKEV